MLCFSEKIAVYIFYHHFITDILVFWHYDKRSYRSKNTEVFKRKTEPHVMVKSLCESVVVLQLQICLTQAPSVIFNQ